MREQAPVAPGVGPLTPEEQAAAREHLRFLQRHRETLRVRWNAAEDLLVNGARPPEDRGVLQHLLGKVDAATVQASLTRLSDPGDRARLLAGIVRFSTDAEILLLWLESLADAASRRAAAGAFAEAVAHLDLAALSEARLARLLALLPELFDAEQRLQILFGLLHNAHLRGRVSALSERLDPELQRAVEPMLGAWELLVADRPRSGAAEQGLALLLRLSGEALRAFPEPLRIRLLHHAVERPEPEAERAAAVLLDTLPEGSQEALRYGLRRAAALLGRGHDAHARTLLRRLKASHASPAVGVLLDAAGAARFDRFVLGHPGAFLTRDPGPGLIPAYCLRDQRPVLLLRGAAGPLQAGRLLPGMLPALDGGAGWLALPAWGAPLLHAEPKLSTAQRVAVAYQLLALQEGLLAAGWLLADARPERFVVLAGPWPTLLLADPSALLPAGEDGRDRLGGPAFGFCRQLLGRRPDLAPELAGVLGRRSARLSQLQRALIRSVEAPGGGGR